MMRMGDSVLPNISALWFIDCPDPAAELRAGAYLDPEKTTDFMERAFTDADLTPIGTSDLAAAVDGADNRVFAAHFGRLAVLAGTSLRTSDPNELSSYLTDLGVGHAWVLISLDPLSDSGCFARWQDGEIQRSFSGTATAIRDDTGLPYPFEGPFWAGEHPQTAVGDPLALPFHPGRLADAAHREWFGFAFGESADDDVDPTRIPVTVYRVGPDDGLDKVIETSVSLQTARPAADGGDAIAPEPEAAPAPAAPVAESGTEAPGPSEEPTAPIRRDGAEEPTIPIEHLPAAEPEPEGEPARQRTPGPISRYFGFRGRL